WAQGGAAEVVGAVHGVAYLSPSLQTSFHQSHWRRNNAVKIASRDGSGRVSYPNSTYKGRLELFPNNTLKISRLQKNDSSVYQVYLEDEVGQEHVENILLTVYDLVPKPTVNARAVWNGLGQCEATLECLVGLEGVTYEWIPPRELSTASENASKLLVSFNPLMKTYTCKVSNPVSSNNASLTYQHPCSWTGTGRGAHAGQRNSGGMGCQVALEDPWNSGGDPQDSGALQGWWWPMDLNKPGETCCNGIITTVKFMVICLEILLSPTPGSVGGPNWSLFQAPRGLGGSLAIIC
ncbi:PREDICTED: CD48 antigen-like, partial [Buceros rhinoceros silvestris]|uniref:CD48 antigen-like n=1 Tax=Buceros rhinoceros silvestris TaxID=175836 RepID=UPI0005282E49